MLQAVFRKYKIVCTGSLIFVCKDYITKYKIKEKYTKSKALRKDLKRSKDNLKKFVL